MMCSVLPKCVLFLYIISDLSEEDSHNISKVTVVFDIAELLSVRLVSKLFTGTSKQMNEVKPTKESLLAPEKQTQVPGANFTVK